MTGVIRLYCAYCNPHRFFHPDRRAAQQGPLGELVSMEEHRRKKARRQSLERRICMGLPAGMADRRGASPGRRCRDGYAWFEGCIEEAMQAQWLVAVVDDAVDSEQPALVLCPKCRRKIR
ncbi:MAG: hypothetical protein H7837_06750 [Magnetococcus sp. MYC-9]